jgi:AAA family ATP:ADP antiporter
MTTRHAGQPEFSGMRLYLWPIHRYELKKLIPMLIIFFLISFNYNVLRTMKDTLVMYAPASGAEVLPFIKVWAMFPSTLLVTFLFTRLSNRFSRMTVTYVLMSFFLVYFALFVGVLYPYRESLEPTTLVSFLQQSLPLSFKWPILMFQNWIFTSFYVMAELWSNIVFFVLIWGFANQVTRLSEAKRFYGLFGVGANFSGILAGQASVFLSRISFNPALPYGETKWEQSMLLLVLMVIAAGAVVLGLLRWMENHVLNDPVYYDPTEAKAEGRVQGRLSMREAFKYLLRSRYLLFLALIVISYNVVINLTEVIWKYEVKELYPDQSAYSVYMNQVSTVIAIFATMSAMFISGNAIRIFGWTFTAMLTPAILMLTSIGFFGFFFLKAYAPDPSQFLLGFTPLAMVVFMGTSQNVLCRAAKYSVFDATKEMAFVPLSPECKLKGKAAIDGVCSRLGKTGGSLIHQALLLSLASFIFSAPYVAALLLAIILVWIIAVRVVGSEFAELAPEKPSVRPAIPALHELQEEGASI